MLGAELRREHVECGGLAPLYQLSHDRGFGFGDRADEAIREAASNAAADAPATQTSRLPAMLSPVFSLSSDEIQ